ncbi:MAG: VPLPA-CTERM sorting domain-containing protein [Tateyamaria sp.]|uniref:VPLPA-CTERM sorting domain-containing protein n=1 Tax=Tateyamaria sp. TaxID=1929288 RepID=UPI00326F9B7B
MIKLFFSKTARIAATGAFVAMVASGSASAMTLTYDGSVAGFKKANVTEVANSVNAGAYRMKDTTSLESFIVFCLDLLASVQNNVDYGYTATNTPFSNSENLSVVGAGGLTGIDRIQRLFDSGYDAALSTKTNSAGFQVALWNAVYDDDWSVAINAGDFYQTASDDGVQDAANGFLSDAFAYTGGQKYKLTFLESTRTPTRSQNLVTVSAVPVPAAGLMLLTAFGGLFVARRRKTS